MTYTTTVDATTVGEATSHFMQTLQQIEKTGEVEPLVELFSNDAELTNLAMLEPLKGKEGARQFWQKYLSVFDRIHSEFTHVVEANDSSVLEWVSKGALSTSEEITYRGVSILEFNHGKVQHFRTYYDSAAFLPQGAKHG
ncbi:nuclear transport factor 2 family protein [Leptolyngbya sp. FACHB-671]|uniref:nuclear transport factor 2 family protein n=1 Tax=Leptolyngbya sp. FACHB-671 TaxID=2692812 RepID=UPI0018EFF324|nr:nuclear transport factor 2 family protein [Leptolyngbya sp. FACHB-671]